MIVKGLRVMFVVRANHDSQVLRKRLSHVLFFPATKRVQYIHGDEFLYDGIFVFLREAVIKISRKSVASLSFRRYSYKLEICSNGCRDNADNNDIRDACARCVTREIISYAIKLKFPA